MSEKHLTELAWKTVAAKHKLKDPKLGKALADHAKCDAAKPEALIKAIALVEKETEALKKEQKANKEVVAYLDEILKEVEKSRKAAELLKKTPKETAPSKGKAAEEKKAVKESAADVKKKEDAAAVKKKEDAADVKKKEDAKKKEEAGDEEDEGVDIKSALTGAMGKVKARKPADPPMGAMLCQVGKLFGVLLSRNVGTAQQNKLKEVLKGTGHKFVKGTCEWGKGDIYTFLLASPLAGAAAGLKKFFQEHAGASYKLRVGTAGAMEEDLADAKAGAPTAADSKAQAKASAEPKPAASDSAAAEPASSPKLSTYVKAKKDWKLAKAAAEKGIAALKAAILQQCDPELEAPVKAKIDVWDGILTPLDDNVILPMIDGAIKETDEDRQADHDQKLAGSAAKLLAALQQHPLASVADANPFGKFNIRAPLNLMLTRLGTAFGG